MTNRLECENLNRVYESKLTKYVAARLAVLYRISTKFTAKQQVDMERAKNASKECKRPVTYVEPRARRKSSGVPTSSQVLLRLKTLTAFFAANNSSNKVVIGNSWFLGTYSRIDGSST
jgi:hypothetical protein